MLSKTVPNISIWLTASTDFLWKPGTSINRPNQKGDSTLTINPIATNEFESREKITSDANSKFSHAAEDDHLNIWHHFHSLWKFQTLRIYENGKKFRHDCQHWGANKKTMKQERRKSRNASAGRKETRDYKTRKTCAWIWQHFEYKSLETMNTGQERLGKNCLFRPGTAVLQQGERAIGRTYIKFYDQRVNISTQKEKLELLNFSDTKESDILRFQTWI